VGGGYAYGPLGPSHHATEEYGMIRTIPNIVVCAPGDPEEAKAITTFIANHKGPCYLRLGKAGEPLIHEKGTLKPFNLGNILKIIEGNSTAVFTVGATLKYVSDFVKENQMKASVYSFPFIKPIDKKMLTSLLKKYDKIITIEEHQASGGFGSVILEHINDLLNEKIMKKSPIIKRIAIQDKFFSTSGSQQYLRNLAGIVLHREDFI
jgi:transketolase